MAWQRERGTVRADLPRRGRKCTEWLFALSMKVGLTSKQVLDVLGAAAGPLSWPEMLRALDVRDGSGRRVLRRLLKGLQRNGQVALDRSGGYQLAGDEQRGVLEQRFNELTFAGTPVAADRRGRLRAGDDVVARIVGGEARVLDVLVPSPRPVIGELVLQSRYPFVQAISGDFKGRVSLDEPPAIGDHGDTVQVRITGDDRRGLTGVVVGVVADGGGVAQASVAMLASHEVPTEFPEDVLGEAAAYPASVQASEHAGHRDLRALPLVTIDGESAKDFDDAVFAEPSGAGHRLVVAIADVAEYVGEGSALDREARQRGNSVYLPDRVIPMLPETLSNGLCSLRPESDRLALVCDMHLDGSGEVRESDFYQAVIRSSRRLTYTEVAAFRAGDGGAPADLDDDVTASLNHLYEVFRLLRTARENRGALDFSGREAVVEVDGNEVVGVAPVVRNDAHRLIEEAMIAANVCAAEFIEKAKRHTLYRVHEAPSGEKLTQLRQALAMAGTPLRARTVSPGAVQDALTRIQQGRRSWILEALVLRSLTQAVYQPENKGHFGLALSRYVHFTSPIRRYADLVVHREIKRILAGSGARAGLDALLATGEHVSMTERRADEVSWGVDAWLKCLLLADRVGQTFDGVIAGVTEFGLFVELADFYVQGLVHVSELGEDYYQFHPESMQLVGERSGHAFQLGDDISVQLVEVLPAQGKLTLVPDGPAPRRKRSRKRTGR